MNNPNPVIINKIQKKLSKWGRENFRFFTWRVNRDPYQILIAEFMLQRTKAEQVEKIFRNFIEIFPDIESLSLSNTEEIQMYIKSLGLNWRARHFIEATKFIKENYNCNIPDNEDELIKIPGIGEYITGVILTVCYNIPYPVIDSNISRVINRIFNLNLSGEIRRKKIIKIYSNSLFSHKRPGDLLFAILDFSAKICVPGKPKCYICPINNECKYSSKDLSNSFLKNN